MAVLFAFLLGAVSGLRTFTSLTAVSWAAHLGLIPVAGTPMSFMGSRYAAIILTLLAIGELIADKLPSTPSRKIPVQFGARLVSGALVGATLGMATGQLLLCLIAAILGAVVGTYRGAAFRERLTKATRNPLLAALIEDAVAILVAVLAVLRF
jgi:uncharacterized membrane protein